MTGDQVDRYADQVHHLIEQRLRIKAPTLEKALARSGRLLPKWAQHEGRYLVHAVHYVGHPKLRLMIDGAKVEKAHRLLVAHLKTIDASERRKTQILGTLGVVSFNLIIVVAALISFLIWRGFL